ncbi:MAG: hypothetical protein AB1547_15425 [Thermodesulfobacteriota bacterium]
MKTIDQAALKDLPMEKRKILVVSADHQFRPELVTHTVHLAERLDCELIAVNIHPTKVDPAFRAAAHLSGMLLKSRTEPLGIGCTQVLRSGSIKEVIDSIQLNFRRIEMIVTDIEAIETLNGSELSIPIVHVLPNPSKGEETMKNRVLESRTRHWKPTILYGLAAAALYGTVFMNANTVMSYFTRGGWYAAMPISTVFVFSFIHGSFASHLWSLLGIEAMKKDALRKTEKAVAEKQRAAVKRPRAYAHINPFHNI